MSTLTTIFTGTKVADGDLTACLGVRKNYSLPLFQALSVSGERPSASVSIRWLGLRSVGLVFGNDLRLDRKQLGPRRIDRGADPMGIRIAKDFDPREVFEKPLR